MGGAKGKSELQRVPMQEAKNQERLVRPASLLEAAALASGTYCTLSGQQSRMTPGYNNRPVPGKSVGAPTFDRLSILDNGSPHYTALCVM
jgi:hypothetical protein